mgnify:CR=1 FL=1
MPAENVDLLHRGKRIVDLDVKSDPAALLALAAKADVLLDCFRPGTCERLGIGPAEEIPSAAGALAEGPAWWAARAAVDSAK